MVEQGKGQQEEDDIKTVSQGNFVLKVIVKRCEGAQVSILWSPDIYFCFSQVIIYFLAVIFICPQQGLFGCKLVDRVIPLNVIEIFIYNISYNALCAQVVNNLLRISFVEDAVLAVKENLIESVGHGARFLLSLEINKLMV